MQEHLFHGALTGLLPHVLQCIEKIEGLSGCHHLEQLWLMENKITTIQGLEGCTRLKELYLYSNRITSVAGLEHLKHLEVIAAAWSEGNCMWLHPASVVQQPAVVWLSWFNLVKVKFCTLCSLSEVLALWYCAGAVAGRQLHQFSVRLEQADAAQAAERSP